MNRRRLVTILVVLIGVSLLIWIQFFEVPKKVKIEEAKMQQDPETHQFEAVTSYKNAYMGDASNMGNLFSALPLNEYRGTLEMDPDTFTLVVNYETGDVPDEKMKQTVIYNTTAALTLIANLQVIEMRFGIESYTVTRENVEKWFGTTLVDFTDPDVFKEKVQDHFKKESLDNWVRAYTEGE